MTQSIDPSLKRYLDGDYADKNPDWDSGDAIWKAGKLAELLKAHQVQPHGIVEIGCGSGAVLEAMRAHFPSAECHGFDIAPDLEKIWAEAPSSGIKLQLGDFLDSDVQDPDLIMLIDVLEHVGNPWEFLAKLKGKSGYVGIHFPLDLSAVSVLRETPLLHVREKVGHLHFFTRNLAEILVQEAGFEIMEARFTNAAIEGPQHGVMARVAGLVRSVAFRLAPDLSARLIGGQTLMVLARPVDVP